MNRKPYLILALATAFAVFIIAIIGMADTSTMGRLHDVYDLPYGDKAGHIGLNGMLTFLVGLAIRQLRPGNRGLVLRASFVIALLMTMEEASQVFVPSRNPELYDLLASYFGIVCGTLAALSVNDGLFRRRTELARAEAQVSDAAGS